LPEILKISVSFFRDANGLRISSHATFGAFGPSSDLPLPKLGWKFSVNLEILVLIHPEYNSCYLFNNILININKV